MPILLLLPLHLQLLGVRRIPKCIQDESNWICFFTTLPFQGGAFTSIFFFIFHFRHLLVAVVRVAVHKFVAAPRMHKLRPGFLLLQFRLSAFQTSLSKLEAFFVGNRLQLILISQLPDQE